MIHFTPERDFYYKLKKKLAIIRRNVSSTSKLHYDWPLTSSDARVGVIVFTDVHTIRARSVWNVLILVNRDSL